MWRTRRSLVTRPTLGRMCDTFAVQNTKLETGRQVGNLITNCWACLTLGGLTGSLLSALLLGPLALSNRAVFLFAVPVKLCTLSLSLTLTEPIVGPPEHGAAAADGAGAAGGLGGCCRKARDLLGEMVTAMRESRVWQPALFIFLYQVRWRGGWWRGVLIGAVCVVVCAQAYCHGAAC